MVYEEIFPDGTVRVQSLLVDFDDAIKVDRSNCIVGPGYRTVSPFG